MRWIGIVCILVGTGGIGLRMSNELELRIRELQTLRQFVLLLGGEIRCLHRPLPEAFRSVGERTAPPFREFLLQTAEDLRKRNGQSAGLIWESNLKSRAGALHLKEADLRALGELGAMLGSLDVKQQLGALDYYQENLERALAGAMEDAKSRKKLYQYLGILSGVLVVILIL